MAKQTFTTGQVLTAAQMTSLQQTAMGGGSATAKTANYVLVAADAGTTVAMNAAGATTITVNTSLFAAGDTVFIQNLGAGVCTITAGTATVNTYSSLALNQYEGGHLYFTSASAAIFYKSDGAAAASGGFTSLASGSIAASVTGVDISSISGSYRNLFLVLRNWSLTTGSTYIAARFNNDSGSAYSAVRQYALSGSASNNLYQLQTSGQLGFLDSAATTGQNLVLQVFDYTDTTSMKLSTWNVSVSDDEIWQGTLLYKETPAINRITILSQNGDFDAGTYELFGVK